ncbi:hypothetical protein FIBSPDRAFT_382117 [Athelia psychrophila]|uniref:Uncharacterized protein n=1 Tax=Athelia psychrophila TaxID=1759441 RepID=A0A167VA11_9AGAM|nr:hypothetical protein FIBSPDRAFT_382117 [Fibularhizoctonia sp. CBS 109695]
MVSFQPFRHSFPPVFQVPQLLPPAKAGCPLHSDRASLLSPSPVADVSHNPLTPQLPRHGYMPSLWPGTTYWYVVPNFLSATLV